MTTYLQKFFFGGQGPNHSRTHSCPRSEPTNYIYAPSACSSTSSAAPPFSAPSRSTNYPTMLPPLRSAAYNTNSTRAQSLSYHRQRLEHPTIYHRGAHKVVDCGMPISSHSISNSSKYRGPTPIPLTSTSGRWTSYPSIDIGRTHPQCRTARGHNIPGGVSIGSHPVQHSSVFRIHSLLAHRGLYDAPIWYDVNYAPSSYSVFDRSTRAPIPAEILSRPATDPPTSRLILKSDRLPWPIVVTSSSSTVTDSRSRRRVGFSIASAAPSSSINCPAVTVLDVLFALHSTLCVNVTHEEWNGLGCDRQRQVAMAYEERCTKMRGGWDGGVKRIDWLGCGAWLAGIEINSSAAASGKALFRRA